MYEYRKLTPEQKRQLVTERIAKGNPPNRPPHLIREQAYYLLTAACYEHRHYLSTPERRQTVLDGLFEEFITNGMEVSGWVVLTNHYHILVNVSEFHRLRRIFQNVHGRTAFEWNGIDNARGRKLWFRYSDRFIRSERHYYTSLNYIHYNPVKHGLVASPYDWPCSSVHWYLEHFGREWLQNGWRQYPVRDYGKKWDEF